MIVDGRALAAEILQATKNRTSTRGQQVVVRAVVVSPSPATESYLRVKSDKAHEAGMRLEVVRLAEPTDESSIIEHILAPGADAVIVQLPLPEGIDHTAVLNSIPLEKDADCLSDTASEHFAAGTGTVIPPVAAALRAVLEKENVVVAGARAVVVGQGKLVGKPAAVLLAALGAEVTVLTKESGDLSLLEQADIVVLGAGVPRLVKPEHVKAGVVLLDAGTSEDSGVIVGDADPACASVASVFTPVPGGIGPVAVACLFANAAKLASAHDLQAS